MTRQIRNIPLNPSISKLISFLLVLASLLLLPSFAFSWQGEWSNTSVSDHKDQYGFLKKTLNGMILSAKSKLFIKYYDLPDEAQYGNQYVFKMLFIRSEKASAGMIFKGERSGFEFSISSKGHYRILYFETAPKSVETVLAQGEYLIPMNKVITRLEYETLSSNLKAFVDDKLVFDEMVNSLKSGVNPPVRVIKVGLSAINDSRGNIGEVLVESLSVVAN